MGVKFPCGKELDTLSSDTDTSISLPVSIKDTYINLSGVETLLLRKITGPDPVIARSVFVYLKDVLATTLENAVKLTGVNKILVVGGVASNSVISNGLKEYFGDNIVFATKELSTDNAVGIAILSHLAKERE